MERALLDANGGRPKVTKLGATDARARDNLCVSASHPALMRAARRVAVGLATAWPNIAKLLDDALCNNPRTARRVSTTRSGLTSFGMVGLTGCGSFRPLGKLVQAWAGLGQTGASLDHIRAGSSQMELFETNLEARSGPRRNNLGLRWPHVRRL